MTWYEIQGVDGVYKIVSDLEYYKTVRIVITRYGTFYTDMETYAAMIPPELSAINETFFMLKSYSFEKTDETFTWKIE